MITEKRMLAILAAHRQLTDVNYEWIGELLVTIERLRKEQEALADELVRVTMDKQPGEKAHE